VGRTLGPWCVVHVTAQPRGQWTVGVHVTVDRTCWLPQTDATLAQAERRESWDTPSGFGAWLFAQDLFTMAPRMELDQVFW